MKIDIFNHLFPQAFFDKYIEKGLPDIGKRVKAMPTIVKLDARFKVMDEFGEYCQVISLPAPPIEALGSPGETPAIAELANDGMAELCRKHPDRFPTFIASLAMNNPDSLVKEAFRAVDHLGASGVQIFTNVNGAPLDGPEYVEFFDEMAKREIGIWMHPTRGASMPDYKTEDKSKYEIWWTFGWPYETSVAMARMVFSGFFDRRPNFKLLTHHMGAMAPYFEGRVGYGWDQLGSRTSNEDYGAILKQLKKRPIDYFRMFHADTALFGALAGTRCGLDFFGEDMVMFASDVPFEPSPGLYIRETIRVIEALGLDAAQKEKIYRTNAENFLKHK
ncbi:MAG: amidohydrolase family protein [Acidobacteriota bacterium]